MEVRDIQEENGVTMPRVTHTYATLEISQLAFDEIKAKLEAADYQDQFHKDGDRLLIDMHGIAVHGPEKKAPPSLDAGGAVVSPEMLRQILAMAQKEAGVQEPKEDGWHWLIGHWQMMKYEECAVFLQEIAIPAPKPGDVAADAGQLSTMPTRTICGLPVNISMFHHGLPFGNKQIRLNNKEHQLVGIIINLDATGAPELPQMVNVS